MADDTYKRRAKAKYNRHQWVLDSSSSSSSDQSYNEQSLDRKPAASSVVAAIPRKTTKNATRPHRSSLAKKDSTASGAVANKPNRSLKKSDILGLSDSEDDDIDSFSNQLKALQIGGTTKSSKTSKKEELLSPAVDLDSENDHRDLFEDSVESTKASAGRNVTVSRRSLRSPRASTSSSEDQFDCNSISSGSSYSCSSGDSDDEEELVGLFESHQIDDSNDSSSEQDLDELCITNDPNSAWSFDSRRKEVILASTTTISHPWPKVSIPKQLFASLYDFQKVGVQWMASLYHLGEMGGILGDDMGMGKTYMTLTYIAGLMRAKTIRNALIVVPLSVLRSWEKEAKKVLHKASLPHCQVTVLTSNVCGRDRILKGALNRTKSNPCLIISTYGMVQTSTRDFKSDNGHWDYVVLDEGHTIKNHKTNTSMACRSICRTTSKQSITRRLMLSGTPIMNKLEELWSLFDWATSGRLLGKIDGFKNRYAKPIENARDKCASDWEIRKGQEMNLELQDKLRPHFLQRLKVDFLSDQLPEKLEMVVWTHLAPEQRKLYEQYVDGENSIVRAIVSGEINSALEAITWLKKLCGHPLLVNKRYAKDAFQPALRVMDRKDLIKQCNKLKVVVDMVMEFRNRGRRTLVFSQSTRMLDILQAVLTGVRVSRIDGSTREKDRQYLVDEFNNRSTYDVMLLSTKAAGVGLTLTGADVVIVYDPSWTPAEDNQAVDRAYRIGQTRPVHVYRMIAAGTVEEKMYEKQVHKDGIRRTVFTQCASVQRYFERSELRQLFKLSPAGTCRFLDMVSKESGTTNLNLGQQSFVVGHSGVLGLSRHDGLYSSDKSASEDGEEPTTPFDGTQQHAARPDSLSGKRLDLDLLPLEPSPPSRSSSGARAKSHSKRVSSGDPAGATIVGPRASTRQLPYTPRRMVEVVTLVDSSDDDNDDDNGSDAVQEIDAPFSSSNKENDSKAVLSDRPSDRLQAAVVPHQQGKFKRSLQILLSLLMDDNSNLSPAEKLVLHEHISLGACSLGLFLAHNVNT